MGKELWNCLLATASGADASLHSLAGTRLREQLRASWGNSRKHLHPFNAKSQVPFWARPHGGGQSRRGACPHGVHILRGRLTSKPNQTTRASKTARTDHVGKEACRVIQERETRKSN